MKVLVVLALALFSVCNANMLWSEPPKNNLDLVKDAFWDYVAKATLTAEDSIKQIRESELGQDVNTKISQSADTVNQYVVALHTRAAPLTQDFLDQFTQEAELLKARMEKDLTAVSSELKPYADELVADLQRKVEELHAEATPYAETMDPQALQAVLLKKSQELKGQLDRSVEQLRVQMVPYTEEMRLKMEQRLEEFQSSMLPLAQSFESQLTQKTQELERNLAPYGEEIRAKMDASAQDLQAQLTALWESFAQKKL